MLLEGGLDWKSMSLTPKDMDFIEAKHVAAREIALALGVPPMLLGIPGDNTYSNYQEATRTFWRSTVLPLVTRTAKAISTWLSPAYSAALELRPDLDAVEALSSEREALWTRIDKATFLTPNEKRAAVGYGPLQTEDGDVARKFNPHHDELGRFTFAPEGAVDSSERPQPASRGIRPPRPPRPPGRRQPPSSTPASRPHVDLPPPQPLKAQEAIDTYRSIHNMPPELGTVAYGEIGGTPFIGVNSRGPGYTDADRAAADQMRDTLLAKYPELMETENIGRIPNDALYHAEATTLLRAARANRGSLAGRTFDIQVDREMCRSCDRVLPSMGLELGNPTVRFIDATGRRKTMRNGAWIE